MKYKILFIALILITSVFNSNRVISATESEITKDTELIYKARVQQAGESRRQNIPGTDTLHTYQNITFVVLNKDKAGQTVSIGNDYSMLSVGDVFFVKYLKTYEGEEVWTVSDPYRLPILLYSFLLFVFLVIILGGKQGIFSLLSLLGSFAGLFYILFPGILAGYNPILLSGALAIAVLFLVMYVTHGFNRMTTSAFIGCVITISITILLSYFVVIYAKLTGFTDEEAVYLNFNTRGSIDFQGLLLGAIIIGVIGIIDDIAITQASVVSELRKLGNNLTNKDIFSRAMKIGKDHTGAVVNSLVLAYTGASLPLLLLIYTSDVPLLELLNSEVIATEIARTIIGSIGLVLAVPITTFFAVTLIKKGNNSPTHIHPHSH